MERKQDIRKELLKKRNSLSEEIREKYSKLIEEHLISMKQYQEAEIILIYASYQSEVSTYGIMEAALEEQKRIFCPKVLAPGQMEFYEINSLNDIVQGYKKIPEPVLFQDPYDNRQNIKTLMIMPLVGFDTEKNRLGYGGGFYDRYLQRYPDIRTIGLGFEEQKVKLTLPVEETDVKPELIVTEKNFY